MSILLLSGCMQQTRKINATVFHQWQYEDKNGATKRTTVLKRDDGILTERYDEIAFYNLEEGARVELEVPVK